MIRSRRRLRFLAGIIGLSLLSCGREVTGPGDGISYGWNRRAALALEPQFPVIPGANAISDVVPFERVRITLRRMDGSVLRDTTITFPAAVDSVELALDVPLPVTSADSGMTVGLSLAYINAAGDTVFRGGPLPITAKPAGTSGAAQPVSIPVTWVPPTGVLPASVELSPPSGNVVAGTTTPFTAVVRDGQGNVMPGIPVVFSSVDTARATVAAPGNGLVTWRAVRGFTRIVATTPNLVADTSIFDVSLPASRLLVVSGDAQSATINGALASPVTLRVTASDSVPVAGIPVTFAVTTGGGSLLALADTSDAGGLVSFSWTLGATVGGQSVTATLSTNNTTQVLTATGTAPVAAQLQFTAAPTTATAGATFAPVTVEARDAGGALASTFTGPVSIALPSGATATLLGTTTVNAVAGVATFNDLRIEQAAAGLALIANSGVLTADTSATLAITAAAAANLALVSGDAQSGTVLAALAAPFVVRVTDAFGNPVAGSAVTFAVLSGGGTLSATDTTTGADGDAVSTLTLPPTAGAVVVTATAAGLVGSPVTFNATANAGGADHLVFSTQTGSGVAGVALTSGFTVQARDAFGNVVTGFTGPITIAINSGVAGATLGGTLTRNAVAGVAFFDDLSLDLAFASYRLEATSPGLTSVLTSAVGIIANAPTVMVLVSGDAQGTSPNTALAQPLVVRVTDAFTNPVAGVTISWTVISGGGTVGAPSSVSDIAGLASVAYTAGATAGTATIHATNGGLAGSPIAFSASIGAGAATQLVVASGATTGVAGTVLAPSFVVEARDATDNLDATFTGPVTVVLGGGPGGATLGGTITRNAVAGVATFDDLTVDLVSATWVLTASSGALTPGASAAFTITPAAAASIAVIAGDAQTGAHSLVLPDSVAWRVTDAFGNVVPGVGLTLTITAGGGSMSPATGTTDAAGEFRAQWTLGFALGTQTVVGNVTLAPAISASANATATAGAATRLAINQQPDPALSGSAIPAIIVGAQDANGNPVTTFTGTIDVVVDSGPALGWSLGGTQSIAATAGQATFNDLTLDRAGQYRLRFRATGLDSAITAPFTVSAGAAAQILAVEGNTQSAPAGSALPDSLGAMVADAFGNPIAGVPVTWSVTTGGGSATPGTSVTGADGIARAAWTLGLTTGAQTLDASSSGFTVGFSATATVTDANVVWTGAVNANWSEPGNWSGGTVPTATDSVRVTTAGNFPALDAPATVGRLRIDAGATLQLDTFPVFVGGTLDIDPAATVLSDSIGAFVMIGATGAISGPMPRLFVNAGAHTIAGNAAIDTDLLIAGGSLEIGGATVTVGGLLSTASTGVLSMTGTGSLTVQGDAVFAGGSTAGLLTNGTLTVRGDLTQAGGSPAAFSASAGHTTVLDGPLAQTVTLINNDITLTNSCSASCFGTLRSERSAGTGVLNIGADLKALGIIDVSGEGLAAAGRTLISAGTPEIVADVVVATKIGWQTALIRTGGVFSVDTLVAWGSGALIVGESVATVVAGTYTITGAHPASILVDGPSAVLDVVGVAEIGSGAPGFTTRGNGRLLMQDAGDTLTIHGLADFGGVTVPGTMTDGVLAINGDFTMTNESSDAFIAEGAHTTRLFAPNPTARFSRIGGNQFANLFIDATGAMTFDGNANILGTVRLGSTTSVVGGGLITIAGDLLDSLGSRWQVTSTHFQANDPVIPHQFIGSVVFLNNVTLDTVLFVGGNLDIRGGLLDVNGQQIGVAGDFEARDAGALRMVNAADTVAVFGSAIFRGASSVGQLTAGHLEVQGNITQIGTADAFAASGTHQTWLTGGLEQEISMANAGSGAGSSHFAALGIRQTGTGTVRLTTDVWVDGMLLVPSDPSGTITAAGAQRLASRGADVRGLTFSQARWVLFDGAPATLIDSVTFTAQDAAQVQFEIVRNGGTVIVDHATFATQPTSGVYLRIEDPDGAANGVLDVTMNGPTPPSHSGYVTVVAPATLTGWSIGAFVWTGVLDGDWANPGNWLQGVVPAISDSVHIPAAGVTNMPALTANRTVRALVNDNAAPISIDAAAALTVVERLAFRDDVAGATCTTGAFVFIGTGALNATLRGDLNCSAFIDAQNTSLDGPTEVLGAANSLSVLPNAGLIINNQRLRVEGTFGKTGSGQFVMANPTDSVDVGTLTIAGDQTNGFLVDGDLVVREGLSQASPIGLVSFGDHRTRFLPGVTDTATVDAAGGTLDFGHIDVARPVRLLGMSNVFGTTTVRSGAVVGSGRLRTGNGLVGASGTLIAPSAVEIIGVLSDTGTFRPDTTIFAGATQDVPFVVGPTRLDYQHVRVLGDAVLAFSGGLDSIAGDLIIEGSLTASTDHGSGNLVVGRDLNVIGSGRLLSQGFPHSIRVDRHATFAGATSSNELSTGDLRVKGDFRQLATTSTESFQPGVNYEVILDSIGTVSFASPAESRFSLLRISESGAIRTMLTDVNVWRQLSLLADGGATLQSDVLGTGGTRVLAVDGASQGGSMTFRNVTLRVQGAWPVSFNSTLTFADFDPTAVQFDIVRAADTITVYDPIFSTTPTGAGRYLRVADPVAADAFNTAVIIDGTPTPLYHNGFAEAVAPAAIINWIDAPSFTWTGGATTADWNTPANWAGGVVPAANDSVFVPDGLLYNPLIPSGTTLRAFVSARTSSPIQSDGDVTITGRLQVPTLGGLDCGGASLRFANPSTPMTAQGRWNCYTRLLTGTLTASDTVVVAGNDLQLEGGSTFDAGATEVTIEGQFGVLTASALRMQDDSAHVRALAGASFGGASTAGLLTAGALEVHGNFTQNGDAESFAASGTHVTLFVGAITQQMQFSNPGATAGSSHFANLAIGQPAGITNVVLNSDVYAIGQLRSGPGPQRMLSSSTGATFTSHGAAYSGAIFGNVRWQVRDGAPITQIANISFSGMDPTVSQFDIERSGGTVSVDGLDFDTAPTSGAYVRVADLDGAANGIFGLQMSNTTPAEHGGSVTLVNGATLTGWGGTPALENQWTGGGDGTSWSDAGNWSQGRAPIAGDSVTVEGTPAIIVNSPTTMSWLIAGIGSAPTFTLGTGAVLQIDSAAVFGPSTAVTMNTGSTLTGAGAVTMLGTFDWNGGTMSGAGGTLLASGGTGTIAASGIITLAERVFAVGGTVSVGGAQMVVADSAVLSVSGGGLLHFTADNDFFAGDSTMQLVNAGTVRKSGTGTVRLDWSVINTGRIEIEADTFDLRRAFDHVLDSVVIAAGATLVVPGQATIAAAVDIGAGGSFYLRNGGIGGPGINIGNHSLAPTSSISGAGTFRTVNADTVIIQGRFDVATLMTGAGFVSFEGDTAYFANGNYLGGGFVSGSAVLSIGGGSHTGGTYFIQTGNFTGTGTVHVASAGALNIPGAGMRGWDLVVDGLWSWTDNDLNLINHPSILSDYVNVHIRPGGTLSMSHAGTARTLQFTGGSTFTNQGTIAKPNGIETTTINGLQIANAGGAINVTLGTLHITNGCSSIGTTSGNVTIGGGGACGP